MGVSEKMWVSLYQHIKKKRQILFDQKSSRAKGEQEQQSKLDFSNSSNMFLESGGHSVFIFEINPTTISVSAPKQMIM